MFPVYRMAKASVGWRFHFVKNCQFWILALPMEARRGKDIVFRFIIEYSSLIDFGPEVVGLFLYEDFEI
jgi:hypothetical protein